MSGTIELATGYCRGILIALLSACTAAPHRVAVAHPRTAIPPADATSPALPANLPATPAGRQLAWFLDILDGKHGAVTAAEIEAHFEPSFLAKVPADKIIAIAAQLAPSFVDARVVKAATENGLVTARIEAKTSKQSAQLGLGATGRIAMLLFQPIAAESFDEVTAGLTALAPKTSLLVAQVDGTTCTPLHAMNETAELAIASTFKLYVLIGLADQIMRGKLTWNQELAIRDEWKSLPGGITQNDAAGSKLAIRTLAERMISISDNTATDHLLYTVGRKNVEAALRAAHHAQPLLDVPLLSTRELFLFHLALEPTEVASYLALKAAPRRAYLDGPLANRAITMAGAAQWKTARHIEDLEWFASTMDLCGAMSALNERAAKVPAVLDVLAINPVIAKSPTWPYVGFKGGSEPGVLAGTWLLRRDDHKTFVVSLVANDPAGPLPDEHEFFGLALGAIELLAKEAR